MIVYKAEKHCFQPRDESAENAKASGTKVISGGAFARRSESVGRPLQELLAMVGCDTCTIPFTALPQNAKTER
tara:strand:- start:323 stop:541 length:219 start_codon:yes stop_codon:yes gene_type:complete